MIAAGREREALLDRIDGLEDQCARRAAQIAHVPDETPFPSRREYIERRCFVHSQLHYEVGIVTLSGASTEKLEIRLAATERMIWDYLALGDGMGEDEVLERMMAREEGNLAPPSTSQLDAVEFSS